ncbi:MAG: TonB-dependent receptor [Gammaproteobacteria bacterium]|nr:TonB-dependent receptor [Gammaproteobacteria bacterium]
MRKLTRFIMPISVLALAIPGLATVASAQGAQEDAIEEIVVSGLRGKPRSSVDSAVPIDTFDASAISAVSHTDLQDVLQTLIPSYNVGRQPISDGASFIRPAELRGLPSHHTLVLVNGKRRHRAALVQIGGSGTQGPDVATIPSVAIQTIEVLRDGASSQYGSDAIAGVINFNLKNNSEGFSLVLDSGTTYEGDGDTYSLAGNVGLPLGENGFISLSAEAYKSDFTERAEQYCEPWFCLTPSNPIFNDNSELRQGFITGTPTPTAAGLFPGAAAFTGVLQQAFPGGVPNASVAGSVVQPWGQPNLESIRTFYNAGYELSNGMELYSFGNYSQSKGDGSFFYRYAGNGTIETLRNADGSFYNPLQKFAGGFTPRFEGEVQDISVAGGIKGANDGGFAYDASVRYGSNEIDYRLFNTINPSYGVDSPTDFKPGILQNEELQFQLDLSNEFDIGTASPLVLAYGTSYMDETYNVKQSSDVASYAAGPHALADPYGFCTGEADFANRTATTVAGGGDFTSSLGGVAAVAGDQIANLDCTDPNDPVYRVVGVGSNGFPGYSPAFSEKYNRDSYAFYGDLSTDVNDRLFLQAAVRYEDYSDFGDELVGKLAGRFLITDQFAVRGSIGTGFRAPTPGQQGTTNVSTRLPNGLPVATGLFPATGSVAQALGATPLRAETSTSYTVGFTAETDNLTITVDFYQIEIDDRFSAISTLDVSPDPTAGSAYQNFLALQAAGVAGAETIGGVFYFTNAFDSRTRGVDVVASYPLDWGNGQETNFQFAYNYNKNKLTSDASAFLNTEDQFDFENANPNTRWNVTANHAIGDFSVMARGRYFGESANSNRGTPLFVQEFGSTFFVDLEASYQLNDNWRLTVGGRNIFDTFPDKVDRVASNNDQCCGRTYVSGSLVPWQGGYFYGRVSMAF